MMLSQGLFIYLFKRLPRNRFYKKRSRASREVTEQNTAELRHARVVQIYLHDINMSHTGVDEDSIGFK